VKRKTKAARMMELAAGLDRLKHLETNWRRGLCGVVGLAS
jgi:hypothetical protein